MTLEDVHKLEDQLSSELLLPKVVSTFNDHRYHLEAFDVVILTFPLHI
jgi:hypothetical protein